MMWQVSRLGKTNEMINNWLQQTAIVYKACGTYWKVRGFGKQRQIADLAFE